MARDRYLGGPSRRPTEPDPRAVGRRIREQSHHDLGPATDLGAAVLAQRIDRAPRQRVVGTEQPLDRLGVVEAVIGQQDERAAQTLHDCTVVDERRRNSRLTELGAAHCRQLVFACQLPDLARADSELLRGLGEGQPRLDKFIQRLSHGSSLPRDACWSARPGAARLSQPPVPAPYTHIVDRSSLVDPLVGQLLEGRYLVGARIARGGMATVYEATDLRLDRAVAVKVMPHALADDEQFTQRFVREARAAARLLHPNIVTVYDQGDDAGVVFLVMEFVAGHHTLRDVIRDEAPLEPRRALALIDEVVTGIATAHEAGIIHRDIKPENVLIDRRGRLKVADFGLARAISSSTAATATGGVLMGTVSYLAPELVTEGYADARSDVYALGVLVFELLTGTKPHAGDSPIQIAYKHVNSDVPAPSSLVDDIPPYLDAFVARATSRRRELRPADAHVLSQQLRRVRHALEHGVRDDEELTGDLTPTIALGEATGEPPRATAFRPASRTAVGNVDEVFDFMADDGDGDFAARRGATRVGMTADFERPAERTLVVGEPPSRAGPGQDGGATRQLRRDDGRRRAARSRTRGWIAFLLILVLAAAAAIGGWYYGVGRFQSTPDVVHLNQSRAARTVEDAGLSFSVAGTAYSETVPAGHVISTDPGPGDKVRTDGTVSAVLSKGPERHLVPDLTGMDRSAAVAALRNNNLRPGRIRRVWSSTVPAGTLVDFDPTKGVPLRRDQRVDLTISRGPEPIDFTDHAGQAADTATRQLSALGFDVKTRKTYDDGVAEGVVIRQRPAEGTGHRGDAITLVVSRGPHLVEVPDVYGQGAEAAKTTLTDQGFTYKEERYSTYLGFGIVADQSPGGGELRPFGSTITIYVL